MNADGDDGTGTVRLRVRDLHVEFATEDGWARAVDGLSFDLQAGRTLAVLGESGSGKSATARAIMGVLPRSGVRCGGEVLVGDEDLLAATPVRRREHQGRGIAMVFQDAQAALNPVLPVGYQVTQALRVRDRLGRRAARARAVELLARVGIPDPLRRVDAYPHQFSGGMRQRVMIAMALAQEPEVLIADEPTTALDVTVQAQILRLLLGLRDEVGMALMFITHDMGVVATVADDVLVMYGGRGVETGTVEQVLGTPGHPYTAALLDSVPRRAHRGEPLPAIGGQPPRLGALDDGCVFRHRCTRASEVCGTPPPVLEPSLGHRLACHHDLVTVGGAR